MNPTATREAPDRERASPPARAARPEPPAAAAPLAWAALSQRWPAIFNIDAPRPLKIGIHEDLLQAGLAQQDLKRALAHYCHTRRYRRTLVEGATRIDLDGRPAGVVTREQAIADLAPDAGRPRGGARQAPRAPRPPPQPMTLSEAQCVKGRLELTLKFSELPKAIPGERDLTFGVDCEGTLIQVSVRPRLWNRLLQAAREYPQWVATVTGKMGPPTARGFVLLEPGLQVFEKKAKADADAAEPAGPRSIPSTAAERVEAPPDWPRRPTLTLPGRGARGAAEADPASGGRRD